MLGIGNVGIILVDESKSERVDEAVNASGEEFTSIVVVICIAAGCEVVMFSSGSPDGLLPTSILGETSILEPDKNNNSSVMTHSSTELTIFLPCACLTIRC